MLLKHHLQAAAFACLSAALSTALPAIAQSVVVDPRPNLETRAQLEAEAKTADAQQQKSKAWLIRYRLENGDFHDGDRIVVRIVRGAAAFADTLILRNGKTLQLPQVEELSLGGVLRSELVPKLTAHLSKFIRDPVVQALPLVRVGILGSVTRPGYYYASAELPISDVLMSAGGPTSQADLAKVSVRRDGQIIIDEDNTRAAIRIGVSMDLLHMQAGDEISVGEQSRPNWGLIIGSATTLLSILFAFGMHR